MSLKVKGLQSMLNTIEAYSNKWRFQFNPSKTTVVTFGESTQMYLLRKQTRHWYLNSVEIKQEALWDHVGITLSGNFSSNERSKTAANKGKQAVGLLMNAGIRPGGLNPICGINIWKIFGLSSMLYGCEVWSQLTVTDIELLNRAGTFAAKRLQGLPPSTSFPGALGTVGMWSTIGYIDKKKLLFFGSLCRASSTTLHKRIFVQRLFSYLRSKQTHSIGYISDVIEILKRYELYHYLEEYLNTCMFPSKCVWRTIVVKAIDKRQTEIWKDEMCRRQNLTYLRNNHLKLQPIVHWEVVKRYPKHREVIANLVNMLVGNVPSFLMSAVVDRETYYICKLCNSKLYLVPYHFIMDCSKTCEERTQLWDNLTDQLPIQGISYLNNLCEEDIYAVLVSGNHATFRKNKEELYKFIVLSALGIVDIFAKISELLKFV